MVQAPSKNGGKWGKMGETLPLLHAVVRPVFAVPAPSCDVEPCCSSLKWVRDVVTDQQDMNEEVHCAAVLLYFNSIVN